MSKYHTLTRPITEQELDRAQKRLDEIERLLTARRKKVHGGLAMPQGTCLLTISPTSFKVSIRGGIQGNAWIPITVTSNIAQTVTFTPQYADTPDPCLGPPIADPSTFTFKEGQSVVIVIKLPYSNCANGISADLHLSIGTSLGCSATIVLVHIDVTSTAPLCNVSLEAPIWFYANGPWTIELCVNGNCTDCQTIASGGATPPSTLIPIFTVGGSGWVCFYAREASCGA